jgi:hypothetical protein
VSFWLKVYDVRTSAPTNQREESAEVEIILQ